MTSRRAWIAGLVGMALAAPAAVVQVPALPSGAGAAAPGAASSVAAAGTGAGAGGGAVAVAQAAQPTTLWSFLGLSGSNLAACKAKLCASQLGQMANSLVTGPVGAGLRGVHSSPLSSGAERCGARQHARRSAGGGSDRRQDQGE